MELINVSEKIEKTYYLQNMYGFGDIERVINLMPSFGIAKSYKTQHNDTFFDTPDYFVTKLDSSIRIRKYPEKKEQILTIVCNNLGKRREFEMKMHYGEEITDRDDYVFFLEDKLQDIYLHRFDFDVIRILKDLKKFVVIETSRLNHEVINNQGFKALVCFDTVTFVSKRNKITDYVVEIKLDCWKTDDNMYFFNKFVKDIEHRVVLIPMKEKKFDAALRAFKMDY